MSKSERHKSAITLKQLLVRHSFALVLLLGTLAAASGLINWFLTVPELWDRLEHDSQLNLKTFRTQLELPTAAEDAELVAEQVKGYTQSLDFRGVAVILPGQKVLYAHPTTFETHALRITATKEPDTLHWEWSELTAWTPIDVEGTPLGTVVIAHSTTRLRMLQSGFFGMALILLFLSGLSLRNALSFAAGFVRPLDRLLEFSRAVEGGQLDQRMTYSSKVIEVRNLMDQMNRMTEQLETQKNALVEARAEAEALSDMKSRFLANMSHEMRTPLNGVLGITEALLGQKLAPDLSQDLNIVHTSAKGLLDIIDNVLDLSRIKAKDLQLEESTCDTAEIVRSSVFSIIPQLRQKDLSLQIEMEPSVPRSFFSDPIRIRQVLLNLLSNSTKFSDSGTITVKLSYADSVLKFAICDEGIGMTKEQIDSVFLDFHQADVSTTRRFGGTGIGLSISQSLARLLGGEILVESTLEQGSTFTLAIPAESKQYTGHVAHSVAIVGAPAFVQTMHARLEAHGIRQSDLAHATIVVIGYEQCDHVEELSKNVPTHSSQIRVGVVQPVFWQNHHELSRRLNLDTILVEPVFPTEIIDVASAASRQSRQPLERLHGHTVLVVEDNPVNQKVAGRALEQLGIKVRFADNGAAAVEQLRAEDVSIDLVLMDLQMPIMDGYQATEKIREDQEDLPIIALTADVVPEAKQRCLAVGMNDFMAKPLQRQLLAEKLIHHLISLR